MTRESRISWPGVVGKALDTVFPGPDFMPPTDILLELRCAEGPYKKFLAGKIKDPQKATRAQTDYTKAYQRFIDWAHRDNQPGV